MIGPWSLDFSGLVVKPTVFIGLAFADDLNSGLDVCRRLLVLQVELEQLGEGDGGQHADAWRQRQHQTDHDAGKVDGADGVQDDEDAFVVDVPDAVPESDWKDACQDVQVEEEREPGGRLVLAHTGDDRDVDLGVAGVPKRVKSKKRKKCWNK